MVGSEFRENYFFREGWAVMPSARGFGFKSKNYGGFFPGKRFPRPFFDCGD